MPLPLITRRITPDEKAVEFDNAPFGIIGLETAIPLVLDRLVHTGAVSLTRVVELLAVNPAKILGIEAGGLTPGQPADLTILAPDVATETRRRQVSVHLAAIRRSTAGR